MRKTVANRPTKSQETWRNSVPTYILQGLVNVTMAHGMRTIGNTPSGKSVKARIRRATVDAAYMATHLAWFDSLWVRHRKIDGATILMYHSVTDRRNRDWINPSHSISVERFERQVRFLKERRTVVPLSRLIDMVESGVTPEAGTVAITFDDGYLDTLDIAGQVLNKYELPASVFAVSGWVENAKAPWVDVMYAAMKRRVTDQISIEGRSWRVETGAEAARALGHLGGRFIELEAGPRDALLHDVCRQLSPDLEMPDLLMNWQDYKRWMKLGDGFEVGAHTRWHEDATLIGPNALRSEIKHCMGALDERLGIKRPHFTYPYGRMNASTEEVLRRSGCRSAIGTDPMQTVVGTSDAFQLTRFDPRGPQGRLGFMTSGAYPDMPYTIARRPSGVVQEQ